MTYPLPHINRMEITSATLLNKRITTFTSVVCHLPLYHMAITSAKGIPSAFMTQWHNVITFATVMVNLHHHVHKIAGHANTHTQLSVGSY